MFVNKKGISELVSYVLLIVLAIAIAGGVYLWLTSIAKPLQTVECPDISLILENYSCFGANKGGAGNIGNITLFLRNNGRFDITGFKIMIANKSDGILSNITMIENCTGDTPINSYGCEIDVSSTREVSGRYICLDKVQYVQISPIKEIDGKLAYCNPMVFSISNCDAGQACSGGIT